MFVFEVDKRRAELAKLSKLMDILREELSGFSNWIFEFSSGINEFEKISLLGRSKTNDINIIMTFDFRGEGYGLLIRLLYGYEEKDFIISEFKKFREAFEKYNLIGYQDIP
jgi:hypothetical protein